MIRNVHKSIPKYYQNNINIFKQKNKKEFNFSIEFLSYYFNLINNFFYLN